MKLLLILSLLISNITLAKDFDTTTQPIETIETPHDYKEVIYDNRYIFSVPQKYDVKRSDNEFIFVLAGKKVLFGVNETPTVYIPNDYGLKNYTRRQLLSAFYDKKHVSNKDVIGTREMFFELATYIAVYKRDGFIFFRQDRNQNPDIQTSLTISSPVNDDVINAVFSTSDEELIMNFIKSFRVK
jgi:hypothetical protein